MRGKSVNVIQSMFHSILVWTTRRRRKTRDGWRFTRISEDGNWKIVFYITTHIYSRGGEKTRATRIHPSHLSYCVKIRKQLHSVNQIFMASHFHQDRFFNCLSSFPSFSIPISRTLSLALFYLLLTVLPPFYLRSLIEKVKLRIINFYEANSTINSHHMSVFITAWPQKNI